MKKNITTAELLAYAICMALILGFVGSMNYEDEENQQEQYCEMVKHGDWPAYKEGVICE